MEKWMLHAALAVSLAIQVFATPLARAAAAPAETPDEHMREELGVNNYTTPSIKLLLADLEQLRPIPFDAIRRDAPQVNYSNRVQLALNFGAIIADGFLIVAAEKRTGIEKIGPTLLKYAKVLGVGEYVTRHSQSLNELAAQDRWSTMKDELIATQNDVERAMIALHDEEIAHLVSLGGWLRGLEMTSEAITHNFDAKRAAQLKKGDLLDYFVDRLETLNPALRKSKLIEDVLERLKTIRQKINATPELDAAAVGEIYALAKETNRIISTPR